MAREFARAFYHSSKWIKTSKAYALSRHYICELCGGQGKLVHHKIHLNESNINDLNISLAWSNLQYLCIECHNGVHGKVADKKIIFDSSGDVVGVVPPVAARQTKIYSTVLDVCINTQVRQGTV